MKKRWIKILLMAAALSAAFTVTSFAGEWEDGKRQALAGWCCHDLVYFVLTGNIL